MNSKTIFFYALSSITLIVTSCSTLQPKNTSQAVKLAPKVIIISAFGNPYDASEPGESALWYKNYNLKNELPIKGSKMPLFYDDSKEIGLFITGIGKSNAAASIMALGLSPNLDLSKTTLVFAGIAGINPEMGAIGSIVIVDYVVNIDFIFRLYSKQFPNSYQEKPFIINETIDNNGNNENCFVINKNNVRYVHNLLKKAQLKTDPVVDKFSELYEPEYSNVKEGPQIIIGSDACSDVFWNGKVYSKKIYEMINSITNSKAKYTVTEMEGAGLLKAFSNLADAGIIDYNKIFIIRSASNYDREYGNELPDYSNCMYAPGYALAVSNVYIASKLLIDDILKK